MLGNHADKFFNTPMRTTVVKGGNSRAGVYNTMPDPHEGGSRTKTVIMAGMGADPSGPTTADPGDIFAQIQSAATQVKNTVAPPPPVAKTNWLLYGGLAIAAALALGLVKFKKA